MKNKLILEKQLATLSKVLKSEQTNIYLTVNRETLPVSFQEIFCLVVSKINVAKNHFFKWNTMPRLNKSIKLETLEKRLYLKGFATINNLNKASV